MSTDPTPPTTNGPVNGGTPNGNGTVPPAAHPNWAAAQRAAVIAAIAGLGLYLGLGVVNYLSADHDHQHGVLRQIFMSYLVGWVYWMSLPLGAMALLFIHYLAKSSWGLLTRRFLESATRTLPLMAALFIPVAASLALGKDSPYWWADPHHAHTDADDHKAEAKAKAGEKPDPADADPSEARRQERIAYAKKQVIKAVEHERHARDEGNFSFLSVPAFIGVGVVLFAIWGTMIYLLNKWAQDAEDDPAKVDASWRKLTNLSGPGLIIYAITTTAASTQWVMSLQEGWASTMFPVIYAVNQFLTTFAFCVALFLLLSTRSPFREVVRAKFKIDMGSLMLAFTLFWSYTSFSQMMLIWIGNLPEEIPFFLKRSNPPLENGWWWVSAGLIAFHFALPFLLLLFRDIKLHPVRLRVVAVYLLAVCAVDVIWWIEPTHEHHGPLFVLMDVGAIAGIGGLWGLMFLFWLRRRPLLPANELFMLPEGHDDEHH